MRKDGGGRVDDRAVSEAEVWRAMTVVLSVMLVPGARVWRQILYLDWEFMVIFGVLETIDWGLIIVVPYLIVMLPPGASVFPEMLYCASGFAVIFWEPTTTGGFIFVVLGLGA